MSNAGKKLGGSVERIGDPSSVIDVAKFAKASTFEVALMATETSARGERYLWATRDGGVILARRIKGKGDTDLCLAHWIKGTVRSFLDKHPGFAVAVVNG